MPPFKERRQSLEALLVDGDKRPCRREKSASASGRAAAIHDFGVPIPYRPDRWTDWPSPCTCDRTLLLLDHARVTAGSTVFSSLHLPREA